MGKKRLTWMNGLIFTTDRFGVRSLMRGSLHRVKGRSRVLLHIL